MRVEQSSFLMPVEKSRTARVSRFHGVALGVVLAAGLAMLPASAESIKHFEAATPNTASEAWDVLKTVNPELRATLSADPVDTDKAHELSYSLENALEVLAGELADVAAQLEEMHLASETADGDKTRAEGLAYIEALEAWMAGMK
ncbi:MAG: DUF6746 family protein [Thioalkalivibrionaceae bacterium]